MSERRNYERHLIRKIALLKLAGEEASQKQSGDKSVDLTFFQCNSHGDLHLGDDCTVILMLEQKISTGIYGNTSHNPDFDLSCNFLEVGSVLYQFMRNHYA